MWISFSIHFFFYQIKNLQLYKLHFCTGWLILIIRGKVLIKIPLKARQMFLAKKGQAEEEKWKKCVH